MARNWREVPLEQAKQHYLYGVRGWLMVFAFGILFGLLREIGSINVEAYKVGMSITELLSVDHPATTFIKVLLALDALMVAVIYWLLFSKHPRFRTISTSLLIAIWPAIAMISVIILGLDEGFVESFFVWAVSCSVWVTYLQRSKRVRVTFEHCILTQEESSSTSPALSSGQKERSRKAMVNPEGEEKVLSKNMSHASEKDASLNPLTSKQHKVGAIQMDITTRKTVPTTATQALPKADLGEEDFYAQAWDEIHDQKGNNKALWAKAFSISQGDEKKTQAKYIEFRVAQLLKNQTDHLQQKKLEREAELQHEELQRKIEMEQIDQERILAIQKEQTEKNLAPYNAFRKNIGIE